MRCSQNFSSIVAINLSSNYLWIFKWGVVRQIFPHSSQLNWANIATILCFRRCTEIGQKLIFFGETLCLRKFSTGKFFRASTLESLRTQDSEKREKPCRNTTSKIPYSPLPYISWTLWTWGFTWHHPIYGIPFKKGANRVSSTRFLSDFWARERKSHGKISDLFECFGWFFALNHVVCHIYVYNRRFVAPFYPLYDNFDFRRYLDLNWLNWLKPCHKQTENLSNCGEEVEFQMINSTE